MLEMRYRVTLLPACAEGASSAVVATRPFAAQHEVAGITERFLVVSSKLELDEKRLSACGTALSSEQQLVAGLSIESTSATDCSSGLEVSP